MKIAIIGSIWLDTPPKGYGGTEDVIYNLVQGLSAAGHDVTFFGPKDSHVNAKVVATVDKPLRSFNVSWENSSYPLYHITEVFDRSEQFDIIHMHLNKSSDLAGLPLSMHSKTPVVSTLHFKVFPRAERADQYILLRKYRHLPYVSISNAQRKHNSLNYVATVYNGIDLKKFPYSDVKGKYLAWLGKINPVKGTKEAIIAAKKAGIKIYVMGPIDQGVSSMLSYYENEVKPLLDDKTVVYLGEVSHNEKTSILSGAMCLLNPILWEEPFGLVMTEAQATGTPVIAFGNGAAPEVISEGKTGFIVNNIDQMVARIKRVSSLDRRDARSWIEDNFTTDKMIKDYEAVYEKIIKNWDKYRSEQNKILKNI